MKNKKPLFWILLLSLIILIFMFYTLINSIKSSRSIITNYKPNNQPGIIVKPNATTTKSIINTATQNSDKSVSNSVTSSNSKITERYISGVCHIEHVPYSTEYLDDSTMNVGDSRTVEGIDGLKMVCTNNSDGTNNSKIELDPSNKKIYSGTKPLPPIEPSISKEECVSGYLEMHGLDPNNWGHRYKAMVYCSSYGY